MENKNIGVKVRCKKCDEDINEFIMLITDILYQIEIHEYNLDDFFDPELMDRINEIIEKYNINK